MSPINLCSFSVQKLCTVAKGYRTYATLSPAFFVRSLLQMHKVNTEWRERAKVSFWLVAPSCLVEVYRSFGGSCCLHEPGDRPDPP